MDTYSESVNRQYGLDDMRSRILARLREAGKDVDHLTRDDLISFDEFHIGGIAETRKLAQLAGLGAGMHILDAGSGLGGPARTLAAEFGCRVTGLDLTEEFCSAATMLTARVGLDDLVDFRHGNALDMPFEDSSFDAVWTQFAGMNIADKERLYAEFRRVLRPGGTLALHEIMAGETPDPYFPVLWADEPSISFLRDPADVRGLLESLGFQNVAWNDLTQQSSEWFRAMQARPQDGPRPLGFGVFIANALPQKVASMLRNLEEKRIAVMQTVFRLYK